MNLPPALDDLKSDQNQEMNEEPVNILAHIAPDEIPYLNEMQGREIIDPDTGLRDYTLLSFILTQPEAKQGLEEANQIIKTKHMAEGGHVSEIGRPIVPELEELRQAGRGKDTELIIITPELADIFNEMHGTKAKINPITGFPEYGFFKELFRVAAPIVGAVLGGPVGAFAGSVAANKATGKSWGDSLKQGVLSGGLTMAAPMIGGMFQGAFPGMSSAMGQGARGIFGQQFGGGLANLFTPGMNSGLVGGILGGGGGNNVVPANTVNRILPGSAYGGGASQSSGGRGGIGGFIGSLGGSNLLPVAALGASALMGMKGNKEDERRKREYEERMRQDFESDLVRSGHRSPYQKVKPLSREYNLETTPGMGEHKFYKDYDLSKVEYMSHGGAIRGYGKGQQDNIPKNIREDSYIIDASTVSDLGDGSSNAGIKELDHFFGRLNGRPTHKKGGYIKALVSDGEYEVSPEKVTALGGGSNKKGAMMLKGMVKDIRKSKRMSGYKLPPKAKPLSGYLKRMNMA